MTSGSARIPVGPAAPQARGGMQLGPMMVPIILGAALGAAVAAGAALLVVAAAIALAASALVLARPELVLIGWSAAILVHGRWVTYHTVGPLFITEALMALLVLGVIAGALVGSTTQATTLQFRQRALGFVVALNVVMLVPALVGLALRTETFDYTTGRNLLLVLYPLFAVIAVCATDLTSSYRYWFAVALGAPAVALLLVVAGLAGDTGVTSTGATRVAAFTFPLAFGIAPIALIAAARESLIRPLVATAAAIPFLVGLLLVNHRSAWLAFVAAAIILFGRRISPSVVVGGIAVVALGLVLLISPISEKSPFGQEIARARTVTSTSDPNASFRLTFWAAAMARSIGSPLFGNGFDRYPDDITPPRDKPYEFPAPHNSFVAIGYRLGLIPLLVVLVMLFHLVRAGIRGSRERTSAHERAVCAALTAIVVYLGATSAFNVYLEAPYAGPLFWTCVGLLAYMVYAAPARTEERLQDISRLR